MILHVIPTKQKGNQVKVKLKILREITMEDFSINLQSLNESVDTTNDWNSNLNSASSLPWADDVRVTLHFARLHCNKIKFNFRSWRIMLH